MRHLATVAADGKTCVRFRMETTHGTININTGYCDSGEDATREALRQLIVVRDNISSDLARINRELTAICRDMENINQLLSTIGDRYA